MFLYISYIKMNHKKYTNYVKVDYEILTNHDTADVVDILKVVKKEELNEQKIFTNHKLNDNDDMSIKQEIKDESDLKMKMLK